MIKRQLTGLLSSKIGAIKAPLATLSSATHLPTIADVQQYPDLANHWWKSRVVQAWCHSFDSGRPIGLVELDRFVFGGKLRPDLITKALRYERTWLEQGTESSKALGQVRGSTRKPFPQKGRGKARVGTIRAPHFRGGYASHGPRPHIKTTDIQSKVYDSAIRAALTTKFAQDQLTVVDSLSLSPSSLSTSSGKEELYQRLTSLGIAGRKIYFLYGDAEPNEGLIRAADSFEKKPRDDVTGVIERPLVTASARNISVLPLFDNELVVMDKAAVEVLEEMYRREK